MASFGDGTLYCSFCGEAQHEVDRLITGPNVNICSNCVRTCLDLMGEESHIKSGNNETLQKIEDHTLSSPEKIKSFLDNYIIGQDYAKKVLAVAVYNHYKRLQYLAKHGYSEADVEISKSNVLLIGPTGCGKTLLAQTLARLLNVPFAIADATTLTEAGYVGDDVENVLQRLIQNADGDVEKAQKGIIYLDEIDKIGRKSENPSITRDVSGEGVQQALLKIIEGTTASIGKDGDRKHPTGDRYVIDTHNILFICGGAFELTEQDLINVLTKPKNAIVKQYKKLFEMDNVTLDFEDEALKLIAKKSLKRKSGARGLRTIVEKILLDTMYEIPQGVWTKVKIMCKDDSFVVEKTNNNAKELSKVKGLKEYGDNNSEQHIDKTA